MQVKKTVRLVCLETQPVHGYEELSMQVDALIDAEVLRQKTELLGSQLIKASDDTPPGVGIWTILLFFAADIPESENV